MIFDLNNELDKKTFKKRVEFLLEKGKIVELTEKRSKKTLSQIKYIYVITGVISMEYGLTIDETKQFIKNEFGIKYTKKGKEFTKSFGAYSKEDISIFIDKVIRKFSEIGLYIPSPEEHAMINQIELEMRKQKKFLDY